MRVQFWGTRGSLAKPGRNTVRYGGNTSCVQVTSAAGTLVILDCGTGAHDLGQMLMASGKRPLRGSILISHTHWDHIQGFPFFAPLFVPGNEWDIYGPRGLGQTLRESLAGLMQYTYFPVTLEQLGANVRYHDLVEGSFDIDDIGITTRYLNHPALTLGYRLQTGGASVVYASDHEPYSREPATTSRQVSERDWRHVEFLSGADLILHDAQYTDDEYLKKVGWGHSPVEYAVEVSLAAGVRKLALTHHDPLRNDDAIDELVETIRSNLRNKGLSLEVFAAAEGQIVEVKAAVGNGSEIPMDPFPAATNVTSAIKEQSVLLGIADPTIARLLSEAARSDNLLVVPASDGPSVLRIAQAVRPSLIILDQDLPGLDGLSVCRAIRAEPYAGAGDVPIIVVAREKATVADLAAGVTEWLSPPFSSVYARTKMRAWILGAACRWMRASIPADEERRLASLRSLNILDTEPEERFDRITRIAAALADVPIAFVTLVDENRQWFKSCHGVAVSETSREVSFCAHVVASHEIILVPDTLQDPRFAENPAVTGESRIRFYLGFPVILTDGSCIGTLCLIDTRPRQLAEVIIHLLQDLATMVQQEFLASRQH